MKKIAWLEYYILVGISRLNFWFSTRITLEKEDNKTIRYSFQFFRKESRKELMRWEKHAIVSIPNDPLFQEPNLSPMFPFLLHLRTLDSSKQMCVP